MVKSPCRSRRYVGEGTRTHTPRHRGLLVRSLRSERRHPAILAAALDKGRAPQFAIVFQFLLRCSAVRQASACAVSVGLCAPLVPITEAPRTPRFGTSCEKPKRSTTFVSRLSPIRVPHRRGSRDPWCRVDRARPRSRPPP